MKNSLNKIIQKNQANDKAQKDAIHAELAHPATSSDRRSFLKKAALGGISLAGFSGLPIEDTIAQSTSRVNRNSGPSELRITDLRVAGRMIRVDTNQGIYGYGEVRDGADPRYALMLKSRIVGFNPCSVEMIWKIIKQFGGHGRLAGGVCGVEMAMWDLCGKAWGVPAWQLLGGGLYRTKVRLYADTPSITNPERFAEVLNRRKQQGFTWLKMDLMLDMIRDEPGAIVNGDFWRNQPGGLGQYAHAGGPRSPEEYMNYGNALHPFTQVQLTSHGLDLLENYVKVARDIVGPDIALGADHFGHFDYNNMIRLAQRLEKYNMAYLEDMVAWMYTDQWKKISDAIVTPTMTGEDIFGLDGFKDLIDQRAVDIVHPDIGSSGGLLETKRIGDYAEKAGIAMAMHQAHSPITLMASVHCAAATQNFLCLEHHDVDTPWWESQVTMTGSQPMITGDGFANVPLDAPGLGIELNEDVIRERVVSRFPQYGYFNPTPEWDNRQSHDRIWSFSGKANHDVGQT